MSSGKFGDVGRSRVAHRSTAASDEMLQSLEHKRLALAKVLLHLMRSLSDVTISVGLHRSPLR